LRLVPGSREGRPRGALTKRARYMGSKGALFVCQRRHPRRVEKGHDDGHLTDSASSALGVCVPPGSALSYPNSPE
jgi:hypothetical protein